MRADGLSPLAATSGRMSEGNFVSMVGTVIIVASVIAASVCILVFGRVQVPYGPYESRTEWSSTLVACFAAAGINGAFFGFLLDKVGSVLCHLEGTSVKD